MYIHHDNILCSYWLILYIHTYLQVVGSGCSYSHGIDTGGDCREVCMWLGVRHTHKKALNIFSREIAPAGTGMGQSVL